MAKTARAAVMTAAGIPALIPPGLKCLRTGARYVEIGNFSPGADFTYDACDIVWRRLTLKGIHNYDTKHLQMGVDFLAMTHDVFPSKDLVTHRVSLADINEGLRLADSGAAVRVAVLPSRTVIRYWLIAMASGIDVRTFGAIAWRLGSSEAWMLESEGAREPGCENA